MYAVSVPRVFACLALVVAATCGLLATPAGAVRVTEYPIAAPAVDIASGPGELLITGTSPSPVSVITTTPSFAVKPGPSGEPATTVTIGPDGNPWFVSGLVQGGQVFGTLN